MHTIIIDCIVQSHMRAKADIWQGIALGRVPWIFSSAWCRSRRVDDRLSRHDLTDEEWQRLLPMMPADARRGRRWSDHRMVIDGIFFRTRTGCPWRDLPGEYGNWKTVYNRHRRWSLDGTWQQILGRLRTGCDEAEGTEWTLSADSTVIRAHQHAAGARHELPAELVAGGAIE